MDSGLQVAPKAYAPGLRKSKVLLAAGRRSDMNTEKLGGCWHSVVHLRGCRWGSFHPAGYVVGNNGRSGGHGNSRAALRPNRSRRGAQGWRVETRRDSPGDDLLLGSSRAHRRSRADRGLRGTMGGRRRQLRNQSPERCPVGLDRLRAAGDHPGVDQPAPGRERPALQREGLAGKRRRNGRYGLSLH